MMKLDMIICPLCNDAVEKLVYRYHIDQEREVLDRISKQNPGWSQKDGLCSRCVDYYHTELIMHRRMLPGIGPHFPVKAADDFIILPTALRLNADPRYTGKGVTICFIDSDFYLHPDIAAFKNRVRAIIDVPNDCSLWRGDAPPSSWHGTMTTVVCAGDGYLSNGLYKGIASDAQLVLLKVQDNAGRITDSNIARALQWVLENQIQYEIRIVNISLGADDMHSFRESEIDCLAEQLILAGITIVAAVGNDLTAALKAPATSPNVITVGGIDDGNKLDSSANKLYHSSYGKTVDEFMKPELVAHAMWIAAPLLPNTKEQQEAELLHQLLQMPTEEVQSAMYRLKDRLSFEPDLFSLTDAIQLKEGIKRRLQDCKYISSHYMHVDGTSFAAPIITSIIAQLLEINPALSPAMTRNVLFSTSARIDDFPAERQGFGLVQPRKACLKVLKQNADVGSPPPVIDVDRKTIKFSTHNYCASEISLVGSFNQWVSGLLLFTPGKDGRWTIEIPILPTGHYKYKFVIDENIWIEDAGNPYREPDGFNGFNSLLTIENTT